MRTGPLALEPASRAVYLSQNKQGARMLVTRETPASPATGQTWKLTRTYDPGNGQPPKSRVLTVAILADGSLGLLEEINQIDEVEVLFDPPLIIVPSGLEPRTSRQQTLTMTVHPLGDRSRVKARGKAEQYMAYVNDEPVAINGQPAVRARHLTSRLTADLSPAKVTNLNEQWFVDHLGLVMESQSEQTFVFGLRTRNNVELWALEPGVTLYSATPLVPGQRTPPIEIRPERPTSPQ